MSTRSSSISSLPSPEAGAAAHSARVVALLREKITAAGGWISFADYMDAALYASGLGYYSAGARKLGAAGDFITAPELSPLFGHTVALQIAPLVRGGLAEILEVGAGSGALAASLLEELERADALPARYLILELSADLRERSRDTLAARVPHLLERVAWLNQLPPSFVGVVIGNEVLDAMPVHLIQSPGDNDSALAGQGIAELGVALEGESFCLQPRPAAGELLATARSVNLPPNYRSEIGLVARGFMKTLAGVLERGVAIFIDYGFGAGEYYHPERRQGTLMCHYRHQAHADPFYLPGLQDITAHVDFTAIAQSATANGLDLAGYTTQAQFLINCGITDLLARTPASDAARYLPLANAANRLLSPAEMGELFKVIALSRGWNQPLQGFAKGDQRHRL